MTITTNIYWVPHCSVGTMKTLYKHHFISSSQQAYEVDTSIFPHVTKKEDDIQRC